MLSMFIIKSVAWIFKRILPISAFLLASILWHWAFEENAFYRHRRCHHLRNIKQMEDEINSYLVSLASESSLSIPPTKKKQITKRSRGTDAL